MHQYKGRLILHTGSMFSGKTSSLRRDINRFIIAGYTTIVFKPKSEKKMQQDKILTHDHMEMDAIFIQGINEIEQKVDVIRPDIVAIDEIHELDGPTDEIIETFNKFLFEGKTLVLAGIDIDSSGKPFDIMKELMPRADYLHKHHAVCVDCGVDSWVSSKIQDTYSLENGEYYEPLCRACYYKKHIKK